MPRWVTVVLPFMGAIIGAVAVITYNTITSNPQIEGQICNVLTAEMSNFDPKQPEKTITTFTILLYLTNTRANSVNMLEYELEVDAGRGFEKIVRVYNVHDIKDVKAKLGNFLLEIPDYEKLMIYKDNKPVEYGKPLYGLILFGSEKARSYFQNIREFRVTCIDVFGRRYSITSTPERLGERNPYLMSELFGLKLTEE